MDVRTIEWDGDGGAKIVEADDGCRYLVLDTGDGVAKMLPAEMFNPEIPLDEIARFLLAAGPGDGDG